MKKGQSLFKGMKHSEETKRKMSEARRGEKHPFHGRHHSEETKQKIRLARAKQVFPLGTNKKRSETQKGRKFSDESIEKMRQHALKRFSKKENHPHYGKKRPEVGKKISRALKGRTLEDYHSKEKCEEIREKIKLARSYQIFPKEDTKIELKIQGFLEELKIEYIKHFYMKYIKSHYRCDIFIPSKNMVIECDGTWWHGDPRYYDKKELTKKQQEQKIRDKLRTDQLVQQGFNVIRLWEDDIKDMTMPKFQELIQ